MFGLCGWFLLAALAFIGVGAEGEQNNWADAYVTALIVAGLLCGVLALLFGVVGLYRALTNRTTLRVRWPITWHGDAKPAPRAEDGATETAERAAWQALKDEAAEQEYLREKSEEAQAEQALRIEKILGENKRLNDDLARITTSRNELEGMFNVVEAERTSLSEQIEQLTEQMEKYTPAPIPPERAAQLAQEYLLKNRAPDEDLVILFNAFARDAFSMIFEIAQRWVGCWREGDALHQLASNLISVHVCNASTETKETITKTIVSRRNDPPLEDLMPKLWIDYYTLLEVACRMSYVDPLTIPAVSDEDCRKFIRIHDAFVEEVRKKANGHMHPELRFVLGAGHLEDVRQRRNRILEVFTMPAVAIQPTPDTEGL